jgi:arginase
MMRTHGLIGVPSSAGAHYPGQEKTPATLRAAGTEDRLTRAGISITDYGDLLWWFAELTQIPATPKE